MPVHTNDKVDCGRNRRQIDNKVDVADTVNFVACVRGQSGPC